MTNNTEFYITVRREFLKRLKSFYNFSNNYMYYDDCNDLHPYVVHENKMTVTVVIDM
jgi:hypothetical protein